MIAPMGFRALPVKLRGRPCEHCVILVQNKLSDSPPERAVKLMVCGGGVFRLAVCSPHRTLWIETAHRWVTRR